MLLGGRRSVGAHFPRATARRHHIPATIAGISCKPRIVW
jgi:hypothetical protein